MTESDERVLVAVSKLAGDRSRLARLAAHAIDRDDEVTALLRAAGRSGASHDAAWRQIREVLDRRGGYGLNLLDLVVEIGQQELERQGEPRTWEWPTTKNEATRR
jgi:hypothetical protein